MKIKWTNKWSGEEGFVKCINSKEKFFENTYDKTEAKDFAKSTTKKALKQLEEYCDMNTYETVVD